MSVLVASGPVSVLALPEPDADLVTEAIVGERIEIIGEREGFYEALVPGHATRLDGRGYPGWVARDAPLVGAEGWSPDLVVAAPNRAGLPLGALLRRENGAAALPGGERVMPEEGTAISAAEPVSRSEIELSRQLLGLPYRWGGTDSTAGMDCSGMVYRIMQLRGVPIPRDADDQFDHAPFSSERRWEEARAGDLVFFGEESVTHVGFYLGEGEYISEHGFGGTMVRAMTDDPYRGFARYE